MTELIASQICCNAGSKRLVDTASYRLQAGELVVLLGPNGAGKTSLLRASLGLITPSSGSARLGDRDCASLDAMQRARLVAYLPQQRHLAWPNRVRDVVALGRFCYGAAPGRLSAQDSDAVDRALLDCDLVSLADRSVDTLSGGERSRMHCARAMAAQTPLLMADEPIEALDPRHRFRILDLFQAYVRRGGGALLVLHDIQLAAHYASRLLWMQQGRIVADGPPEQTLTAQRIESVYGVRARVQGRQVELLEAL